MRGEAAARATPHTEARQTCKGVSSGENNGDTYSKNICSTVKRKNNKENEWNVEKKNNELIIFYYR